MYLRTIKAGLSGSITSVRLVEAYRKRQGQATHLADLGRKDLWSRSTTSRFLDGIEPTVEAEDPDILDASTWGPVLGVRALFDHSGCGPSSTRWSVRPRVCRSPTERSSWSSMAHPPRQRT